MKSFSISRLEMVNGETFIYGYYISEINNRAISCTIKINAFGSVMLPEKNRLGKVLDLDECSHISKALNDMSELYIINSDRLLLNFFSPYIIENNE